MKNSKDSIWKIVKSVRRNYLFTLAISKYSNCYQVDIKSNIDKVQQELNLDRNIQVIENVASETLETAARMYAYLSFCPPKQILYFYKELFEKSSVRDIIFAVPGKIRVSSNAEKKAFILIWKKVTSFLELHNLNINTMTNNLRPLALCGLMLIFISRKTEITSANTNYKV